MITAQDAVDDRVPCRHGRPAGGLPSSVRAAIRIVTNKRWLAASSPTPEDDGMFRTCVEQRFRRGIVPASQVIRSGRTSRIPRPPALSSREPVASRHFVCPAARSVRTSLANTWRGFSASSFGCNLGADARSIHARKSLFASGGRPDPACLAGRGDGGGSGSLESALLYERPALDWCPSRGLDALGLTALRQSSRRRVVGSRSPHAPLRMTNKSCDAFHARSSSGQG